MLRRTVLGGASAVVASRASAAPSKKVAIFLPGTMGSSLSIDRGGRNTNIWSDSPWQILDVLVNNQALLDVPPEARRSAVVRQASFAGALIPDLSTFGFPATKFYASI